MCYSAMLYSGLKKNAVRFKARIDYGLFDDLFDRRAQGEKITIPKALEFDFASPHSPIEKKISAHIDQYVSMMRTEKEKELFALKKRLADAERKLSQKFTKGAEKEKGISERKTETTLRQLERLKSHTLHESDSRIFAFHWAPVLIWKEGERVIVPMRYHLRPPHVGEDFDRKYPGCYNARRDSLTGFWRNEFGKKHALLLMNRFFENVKKHDFEKRRLKDGEKEENLVLQFKPQGMDFMIVPCIWDHWSAHGKHSLNSFALITDEPPKEVEETGHNRCPIFIKESEIDAWLNPSGKSDEELFSILDYREKPFYEHALAA